MHVTCICWKHLVVLLIELLDLISAHYAASEDAVTAILNTTDNLSLVSLMNNGSSRAWCATIQVRRQRMLSSSYVHIRSTSSSCTSWTHVMEHDWTLCVSPPFLIQGHPNAAFGELRGSTSTIMEVVILNLGSNSIRRILSSMG